jgi:hypothetical protein
MNLTLVYPMFAMIVLTFGVAMAMLYARVRAVQTGTIKMGYFKTYSDGEPPELVLKTQRHFANLFELPVLYYAACIVAMILPIGGWAVLLCAWLFVVARVLHALIHIGGNRVKYRMRIYLLGWIAVLALWGQIVYAVASQV